MKIAKPSISSLQQELITSFEELEDNPQWALDYLVELGKQLPSFPHADRVEAHLVEGCMARVWLTHRYEGDRIFFQGDSDAMITKGLLAMLIHVFSGQRAEEIVKDDFSFLTNMKLPYLLGSQRRLGLGSMVGQIRLYAKQHKRKR